MDHKLLNYCPIMIPKDSRLKHVYMSVPLTAENKYHLLLLYSFAQHINVPPKSPDLCFKIMAISARARPFYVFYINKQQRMNKIMLVVNIALNVPNPLLCQNQSLYSNDFLFSDSNHNDQTKSDHTSYFGAPWWFSVNP